MEGAQGEATVLVRGRDGNAGLALGETDTQPGEGNERSHEEPGVMKKKRGWDGFLPFYSQWFWTTNWLNKKCKAWYHGPRIKWMNLVKERKKK